MVPFTHSHDNDKGEPLISGSPLLPKQPMNSYTKCS